jgi:hypothetical protein
MDYESFLSLFGIRKPRSTRKIVKEKESSEELKLAAFHRIFNKSLTLKLIERFFNSHSLDLLIKNSDYLMFIGDKLDCKYFTSFKAYDEISNTLYNLEQNETSSLSHYSEDEWSSINEEISYEYIEDSDEN